MKRRQAIYPCGVWFGELVFWVCCWLGGYGLHGSQWLRPRKQTKPSKTPMKQSTKQEEMSCEWRERNGMKWVCFLFHSFMNDGKQMNANGMKWTQRRPKLLKGSAASQELHQQFILHEDELWLSLRRGLGLFSLSGLVGLAQPNAPRKERQAKPNNPLPLINLFSYLNIE